MSIRDVEIEGKAKQTVSDDLDISDLDLSPLFMEPESTGIMSKVLPWISVGIGVAILIVVAIK